MGLANNARQKNNWVSSVNIVVYLVLFKNDETASWYDSMKLSSSFNLKGGISLTMSYIRGR